MVFPEAQSMGVPVVSTTHASIPEVVRHGETGLLEMERNRLSFNSSAKRRWVIHGRKSQ